MNKTLIKTFSIIEIILGFLGVIFGISLIIYSYSQTLSGRDGAGGHATAVAVGQAFVIIFLLPLIAGIFTLLRKRLGRMLQIIGCYIVIAVTLFAAGINLYTVIKDTEINTLAFLFEIIAPFAFFTIIPVAIIYFFTRPNVKEQFR